MTARPQDEAWALLADVEGLSLWTPGLTRARRLEGAAHTPGRRRYEFRYASGRPLQLAVEVLAHEAPSRLESRYRLGDLAVLERFTLATTDEGATRITFRAEGKDASGAMSAWLLGKAQRLWDGTAASWTDAFARLGALLDAPREAGSGLVCVPCEACGAARLARPGAACTRCGVAGRGRASERA